MWYKGMNQLYIVTKEFVSELRLHENANDFHSNQFTSELRLDQNRYLPRFRVHFETGEARGVQQTQCTNKG